MVNTHIVETESGHHMIDAQFLRALGAEVRAFAGSLGKPIRQRDLFHADPDHLLGASQFADVPFITSDDVLADAQQSEEMYRGRKAQFSDETPLVLPAGGFALGTQDWDGVSVMVDQVADAEASHTLTVHILEAGLAIVQNLLDANAHALPLGKAGNWIAALKDVAALEGLRVLGAGHGLPAAPGAVEDAIASLTF
ncbi:MAG: hypothetical protein AAF318_19235 [Pseudomonadota bacterium]